MSNRRKMVVDVHPSRNADIGRWLWAMQDARQLTLEELDHVTPEMIDWRPPDGGSSIGTILFHIAAIEADWLYVEVLESDLQAEVGALFAHEIRDDQGKLTQVAGESLADHLERLEAVRNRLLAAFQQMGLAEFRRARSFPEYDVTPEWVLHHLLQHEAEHRSQIGALRNAAQRAFSA